MNDLDLVTPSFDELSLDDQPTVKPPRPESLAAIRLLQGVVYSSDRRPWDLVLTYRSDLEDYYSRIGLMLVVDEADGLAYLRQYSDDERDIAGEALPRLIRRMPLTYDVTLLCALLRDEMRHWEDHDLDNDRCTVTLDALSELWKTMQPATKDDVQCRKSLEAAMKKLDKMSFVRPFGEAGEFEIRRILKARLPMEKLTALRDQMKQYLENSTAADPMQGDENADE